MLSTKNLKQMIGQSPGLTDLIVSLMEIDQKALETDQPYLWQF